MKTTTDNLDPPMEALERQDAKLDELASLQDDCIDILNRSNREAERFERTDPARRGGLFWWLLVFATFAFLSGAVFSASYASAQSDRQRKCIDRLSALADPSVMSRTTARRKATKICKGLEYGAPSFFRAISR